MKTMFVAAAIITFKYLNVNYKFQFDIIAVGKINCVVFFRYRQKIKRLTLQLTDIED